jgi:hypothetical protein
MVVVATCAYFVLRYRSFVSSRYYIVRPLLLFTLASYYLGTLLQELGATHPEVLAKLRADRAAEYVAKCCGDEDPSKPPAPGRAMTER